jgi:hypothetical protein
MSIITHHQRLLIRRSDGNQCLSVGKTVKSEMPSAYISKIRPDQTRTTAIKSQ